MCSETLHIPVMKNEVLEQLQAKNTGKYLDCTFGGGGHTQAILEINPANIVYACDRDADALERGAALQAKYEDRLLFYQTRFSGLKDLFQNEQFSGILADLGLSSDQLASGRGFSFDDQDSLDMRMDQEGALTAWAVVNEYSVNQLRKVFRQGGVSKGVNLVAEAIIKRRPIDSAAELENLINSVVPREKKINPATVFFQAIRIEVNQEFKEIESLLDALPSLLYPEGRCSIISFHSLEDKLVASKFRELSRGDTKPALSFEARGKEALGTMHSNKATEPREEEIAANPRSRSARLRTFIMN